MKAIEFERGCEAPNGRPARRSRGRGGTPRVLAISAVILAFGSTPPWPGLAPWLSLTSIIFTCGLGRLAREGVRVERPSARAAAEIAGRDLPDDVAAVFAVIAADRALAGIVGETAQLGAPIERHDRVAADGAETRAGNIEQRCGIGLGAVRAADGDAEVVSVNVSGPDRMRDPAEAGALTSLTVPKGCLSRTFLARR